MADSTAEDLRDVLLANSDHRACRRVFEAHTDGHEPDLADLLEAMRATGGDVALIASDGAADVYARWQSGRYEHVVVWPPWTVGGYDHGDRDALARYLADKHHLRATLHDRTPFDNLASLVCRSDRLWP